MIGAFIAGALGLGHRILQAAAPIIAKAAPWILVAVLGAVAWHHAPIWGPAVQIRALEESRDAWKRSAEGWEANARAQKSSRDRSEALRREETQAAGDAVEAQAQQCRAEVAAARASARVIERIVTRESSYDENRCPIRSTVDAGSLRDALAPGSRPAD